MNDTKERVELIKFLLKIGFSKEKIINILISKHYTSYKNHFKRIKKYIKNNVEE